MLNRSMVEYPNPEQPREAQPEVIARVPLQPSEERASEAAPAAESAPGAKESAPGVKSRPVGPKTAFWDQLPSGGLAPPTDEASRAEAPSNTGVKRHDRPDPGAYDPMEPAERYKDELAREMETEDAGDTAEAMDDAEQQDGDADMGLIGVLGPSADDVISEILLQQLGSSGRSYRRERRTAGRRLVSEMYSPPRVTEELRRKNARGQARHRLPGFALDLTVLDADDGLPWDFSQAAKRDKARSMRSRQRPYMLIGSPECKTFSALHALNKAGAPIQTPTTVRRSEQKRTCTS